MNHTQLCTNLLGNGPYARSTAPFRLLEITGPEAGEFLQRLCTQDVVGLADGQVLPTAFLDAKGKLLVTALAFRRDDSFWLELQAEQADRLQELLERYHFTEKLTIHSRSFDSVHEHVAAGGSQAFVGECHWSEHADGPVLHVERRGVSFTRCHGGPLVESDVTPKPLGEVLAESARMIAGLVRIGLETEASTLALEADLEDHCSRSKGCYTGQEIVARIHTYGKVNRKLCLLRMAAGERIDAPVALHECEDDIPVGRVMHAVPLADPDGRLGLGYLPKDFQAVGTKLTLLGESEVEVIGFAEVAQA